jgi:uncharacterized protein (DUF433 family)
MLDTSAIFVADPDILGGVPVFTGTRVPVRSLLELLAEGGTIEEFLDEHPSVSREQAKALLTLARDALTSVASTS